MEDINKIIYFDNAATSWPKLKEVREEVDNYFKELYISPGRTVGADIISDIRNRILTYFDAGSDYDVALVPSATIGMNIVIKSIISKENQIITTNCEHHCVYRPLEGFKANYVVANYLNENQEQFPEEIYKKINKKTKAIIMNHGSNVTGDIFNVREIGRFLKEKNIIFVVDVSQTAGLEDVSVKNMNADIIVGAAHKHLYGLPGIGYIIYKKNINLLPIYYGGTGKMSSSIKQPVIMPDMLESGTPNLVGLLALKRCLDVVDKGFRKNVREHENKIINYFIKKCNELDTIRLFYGREGHRTGVISLCINNLDPTYVISPYLKEKGNILTRPGLHCAPLIHKAIRTFPEGTVRISFSKDTTTQEVDVLIDLLKELVYSVK